MYSFHVFCVLLVNCKSLYANRTQGLVYVHMYAAYDTRWPICNNDFFPPHLCLVVYMYPIPICDVRCATAIFSLWDPKNRMTSEFR